MAAMRTPRSDDLLFAQLQAAAAVRQPWGTDHESTAVTVKDGSVPVGDVAAAARRLAQVAQARGVAEGDWCVVRLQQPLDVLVAVAGLTAVGAVPVLFSPRLDAEAIREALSTVTEPLHLLVTEACAAEFPEPLAADRQRLLWEDLVSAPPPGEAGTVPPQGVERAADQPYLVTHTSGTTGVPKLAIHTRNSFYQQSAVQARMLRPMRLRGYLAAAISPVHVRTLSGLLAALRLRLPVVLLASEDPDVVGEQLLRWRPHYLETHPNTFVTWEKLAERGALSSVRLFLGTFDAVHPPTIARLLAGSERRLPLFTEVYAQSELGPIAFRIHRRRDGAEEAASALTGHRVGRPLPGYNRLRIVDESGRPVPAGRPGRIQVRSKGRFAGYLNVPERFRENLSADGWWDTGDWGARSRTGALWLMDRQVERLAQASSGIALEDVLLSRLPEAAEVVVVETDDALRPVVACRDGGTVPAERWEAATAGLPALAAPRFVAWKDIPRTATGKVRRTVLRDTLGW